jgi:ABC-2 type transport system permease protein
MTAIAIEQGVQHATARVVRPIPTTRLISLELRKMFDTRSGFWMMASIVITAVLATGAVIIFAPDSAITYDSFAAAIGVPITIILPMVAILSVTGEWSQRSGLTTFTLVPHRSRVIGAKAIAAVVVGVVSIGIACVVGAAGNLVGSALTGNDPVWNVSFGTVLTIVLANVLGMMIGFMLGVLFRNSAGAIVGYFVFAFVLPTIFGVLAATQEWFRDLQPWVDFNYAQGALFEGGLSSEQWANLGVTGVIWLILPLIVGVTLVLRSEVK